MFEKLAEYVRGLFQGVPHTPRNLETQEQLISDLQDKYTDLVAEGVPPEEAYLRAIDSIGDLSDILDKAAAEPGPAQAEPEAEAARPDEHAQEPSQGQAAQQDSQSSAQNNQQGYQQSYQQGYYTPDPRWDDRRRTKRGGCITAAIILFVIGMIGSISMDWVASFVNLSLLEDLAAIPLLLFSGIGAAVLVYGLTSTRAGDAYYPPGAPGIRRRNKRASFIAAAIILFTVALIAAVSMDWVSGFVGLYFLDDIAALVFLLIAGIGAALLIYGLTSTRARDDDYTPPGYHTDSYNPGPNGYTPGYNATGPGYPPNGTNPNNYNPGQPPAKPYKSPLYAGLHSALWSLTVLVYLIVSFTTRAWYITWVIFLCAVAVQAILHLILEGRNTTPRRVRSHIYTILWMSCLIAFFIFGFWGNWPWIWMLFPLTVCIQQIIRLSFLWREYR